MNIALTGASGFIGRHLIARLLSDGHRLRVLGRRTQPQQDQVRLFPWNAIEGEPPIEALEGAEAIIHMAGEPIAQRWSAETKQRIRDSRVLGTRNLVNAIGRLSEKPRTLVSSSAIGYYGDRGGETLTESSRPGEGFLPEVCTQWEHEALQAASLVSRVVMLRTGIVLGLEGGALKEILPLFRAGVGGPLASGRQWMSWIHIEDMVELLHFALVRDFSGPVNATAPNPVRNREFGKTLGSVLNRPAVLPAPAFALKLMFGEMAEVVLGSQRVLPAVATTAGFQFRHSELRGALQHLLH